MPETISNLADRLLAALGDRSIAAIDASNVNALGRVADAITWDLREQVTARKRVLWRADAIISPPAGTLTRTVILSDDVHPGLAGTMALVRRTDLDAYFLVSTNDEETYVFPCD